MSLNLSIASQILECTVDELNQRITSFKEDHYKNKGKRFSKVNEKVKKKLVKE